MSNSFLDTETILLGVGGILAGFAGAILGGWLAIWLDKRARTGIEEEVESLALLMRQLLDRRNVNVLINGSNTAVARTAAERMEAQLQTITDKLVEILARLNALEPNHATEIIQNVQVPSISGEDWGENQ